MRIVLTTLILAALSTAVGSAADAKAGKAVFDRACKACHGPDGEGNPGIAKMMKVDMRDLKSPAVQAMSDADLKKIVTDGKGKMKPVASVTGASVDDVVAYLRSIKK